MAANMGQVFAFAAVFVFVITTLGSSVFWGMDADAEVDDPYLLAKYGDDGGDRNAAMGNYLTEQCVPGAETQVKDCSDSVALLKAKVRLGYHTQRVVVMTETFQSIAVRRARRSSISPPLRSRQPEPCQHGHLLSREIDLCSISWVRPRSPRHC